MLNIIKSKLNNTYKKETLKMKPSETIYIRDVIPAVRD
jgi:hypothetical protein